MMRPFHFINFQMEYEYEYEYERYHEDQSS